MSVDWLHVRVARKSRVARDVVAFELRAPEGGPLPAFDAGSHVDLELPNGAIRQYSLCGAPACRDSYHLAILLEHNGRGGSRSAHEDIAQGQVVRISPPRNLFALHPSRHTILMAGGIGITPILAMAEQLCADGAGFALHYCARTADRAPFLDRLDRSPYAHRVVRHFDDQPHTRLDAARALADPDPGTRLYVCGPGGFMDHVLATARAAGWQDANIHVERFAAAAPEPCSGAAFDVEIAGTGIVVPVAADQTVAGALAAHGFAIPLSCEQGICGTCVMRVLEGTPDHRDMCLSREDRESNRVFTPCCSRSFSRKLVVQL